MRAQMPGHPWVFCAPRPTLPSTGPVWQIGKPKDEPGTKVSTAGGRRRWPRKRSGLTRCITAGKAQTHNPRRSGPQRG